MSKNLYGIISNAVRGTWLAFVGIIRTYGKVLIPSFIRNSLTLHTLRSSASTMAMVLGSASMVIVPQIRADVVPDASAPSALQPQVGTTASGVTQVNIQTPSAAGVSRNVYTQFDVDHNGVILNNSSIPVSTQLGGWINGNPNLARGTAQIILNEVNSANPSSLLGYVEIGGAKAQVVIANPAGITCNGCGFINASRATLTTGTPLMEDGALNGFQVDGGTISITGDGMDTSGVNYTDLISRAVEINAGIWANDLKITTGINRVSADNSQIIKGVSPGGKPEFAIDVASLGGMYAGKIKLVGTEEGVGVRNAGVIGATAGAITISADGKLVNSNEIRASQAITVNTTDNIENSGVIYAQSDTHITTSGELTNRGAIDGQETVIEVATLNNLGTGQIYGDHIAIQADTVNNLGDGSDAPVIAARTRLDIGATTINNQEGALLFSLDSINIGGELDVDHHASGKLGTLNNNSASIEALGSLTLVAGQINNTNEHVTTQTVEVANEDIDIYKFGGHSYSPDEVYFTWTKHPGVKYYPPDTDGMSFMDANCFFCDNSDNNIYIHAGGAITRDFWLYSFNRTTTETELLTSAPGKITAGGDMQIEADNLYNSNSQILAGGNLLGSFGTVNNEDTPGQRIVSDHGTAWYVFDDDDHDDSDRDGYSYHPAPSVTDFTLVSGQLEGSVAVDSSGTSIPDNSLYQTNPDPSASYLIEADPRFANYGNWLASDYMLDALGLDPTAAQKRMGDGFYEQRLLSEQVAKLTGQRYLAGYNSDEEQYRALMNAGVTFAQEYDLTVGVALSAEQMALLTSDIVWLVEQEISLKDGSTQKVLVPRLYASLQDGDLAPSGALLSADNIQFDVSGDLINGGSIAGRQIVSLTAENIKNLGGRISGRQTYVAANNDLANLGGSIEAEEQLIATAGHDLTVASTTGDQESDQGKRTSIKRVAGLYVTGENGVMVASAGNDLSILAGVISNNAEATAAGEEGDGSTTLIAGNDLKLGTVTTSYSEAFGDKKHKRQESGSSEVGSVIQTSGDLNLVANNDVSARAASISSDEGALLVQAGNDIQIESGKSMLNIAEQHNYKKKSTFSSKKTTIRKTLNDESAVASTMSADRVTLLAEGDIQVKGSNLVATNDVNIQAEGDINIEAAKQTHNETYYKKTKKSGVFSTGSGVTIGKQKMSTDTKGQSTTAAASTVGSIEGDVNIQADQTYNQTGSDLIALEGDVNITAGEVNIKEARETSNYTTKTKFKQSGLSINISNPVIDMAQTAQNMSNAASKTGDPRMQALAAGTVGLSAYNTYDAVQKGQGGELADQAGGVKLSVSLGTSKSKSTSTSASDTARGSSIATGGDINITATPSPLGGEGRGEGDSLEEDGQGEGEASGNLNIQGSELTAGNNINLYADNDITMQSAENRYSSSSKSKSSSASVGVSFNFGANAGAFLDVAASKGKGKSTGNAVTYDNSHVTAGNKLTIESGNDTTLKGAVAKGKQVEANIGGNLTIESQQDIDNYSSESKNSGFSVSVAIPGTGAVGFGGSVNAGKSNIDSEYASVQEQSGIKAGDEGFQIEVNGHTQLTGAVIASNDAAVDNNKNSFSTGSLGMSDIENRAEYEADSTSIGIGYSTGEGVGTDSDGNVVSNGGTPNSTLANLGGFSATPPVAMSAEGEAESTTKSGISGMAGDKSVRSDKDGSNSLDPIFDEEEINAGFEIVSAFSKEVGTFLKNRAAEADSKKEQAEALEEQAKDSSLTDAQRTALLEQAVTLKVEAIILEQNWGAGGTYRQILTALTSAASGNVTGSSSEFIQSAVVNYLQGLAVTEVKRIADSFMVDGETTTESETIRTALQALVGCAGAAASGQSCSAGAQGAAASVVLNNVIESLQGEGADNLSAEQKEAQRNLVANLVAGIATAAGAENVATITTAAIIETENNYLTPAELAYLESELEKCGKNDYCRQRLIDTARILSSGRDFRIAVARLKCEQWECSDLDKIMARLEGAFNLDNVFSEVRKLHPDWSEEMVQQKTMEYYQEAQKSFDEATWRVISGTLDTAGAIAIPFGLFGSINKGVKETAKRTQLIDDLLDNGIKINPGNVVDIRKLPDGRTVWLETGNDSAGLWHIYMRHEIDFINKGISHDDIPIVIMNAVEQGTLVGTSGSANVYRIIHKGVEQNIAITVSSNGFVVQANPVSKWKSLL